MRRRRKHRSCLNCGELLSPKHNYCPSCGQENTDNEVSIGLLFKEFTSNFFSLDSRFGRTLKPFLINPGKITIAFNEGKRVRYANPIRWYLVISLIHFFFLSISIKPDSKDQHSGIFLNGEASVKLDSITFLKLNSIPDTTGVWPFSNSQLKMVNHLAKHTDLTEDEIYDTLNLDRKWFSEFTTKKTIRASRDSAASINEYLLQKLPIIIFCMLPIYALLLKLFFRKQGLYIKHLIHSIHIHSFFFFIMSWIWVFSIFDFSIEDAGTQVASIITFIYILLSFRKVYHVKWATAILKLMGIGICYTFALAISLMAGIVISFIFY